MGPTSDGLIDLHPLQIGTLTGDKIRKGRRSLSQSNFSRNRKIAYGPNFFEKSTLGRFGRRFFRPRTGLTEAFFQVVYRVPTERITVSDRVSHVCEVVVRAVM